MAEEQKQRFELRKVYVKDMSFESPMSPSIFTQENAAPSIDVQLNVGHESLGNNVYESVLTVTVNGKLQEKDAFLAEVQQAGVYEIAGINPESRLAAVLEVACPNMLFPFAREAINELVVRGGFPQLLLSPVNFESLYRRKAQSKADNAQSGESSGDGAADADADQASS